MIRLDEIESKARAAQQKDDCLRTTIKYYDSATPETVLKLVRIARCAIEVNKEYRHELGHYSSELEEALKGVE
jgi:hypothetical protein